MKRLFILLSAIVFCGYGCSVQELVVAEETQLVVAATSIDEALLLDVGVVEFDSGIPDTSARAYTDVIVSGSIVQSDGEYVELQMIVTDATGRHWFTRNYETQTGLTSYSKRRDRRRDPYQKVFNDFANDLQQHAAIMPRKQLQQTRQISELQFFSDMSPAAYNGYLTKDEEGITTVVRLPAENDPSVSRMRQIRERDRLVVDTLNRNWRKNSRAESVKYRQEKRSALTQALVGVVVLAGSTQINTNTSSRNTNNINRALQYQGISRGLDTVYGALMRSREAGLHLDAITELSESFGNEAAPMVVSIEGQERRLTGTAEAQFESWRQLLRNIYEAETGFSSSVEVGAPARAPEPTG
jgi:hypothetical protein